MFTTSIGIITTSIGIITTIIGIITTIIIYRTWIYNGDTWSQLLFYTTIYTNNGENTTIFTIITTSIGIITTMIGIITTIMIYIYIPPTVKQWIYKPSRPITCRQRRRKILSCWICSCDRRGWTVGALIRSNIYWLYTYIYIWLGYIYIVYSISAYLPCVLPAVGKCPMTRGW